jgi:hypothetical protein
MASTRLLFPTAFGPINTFNGPSSTVVSLNDRIFFRVRRSIGMRVVLYHMLIEPRPAKIAKPSN